MRYGVLTTALLALALQGCGGGSNNDATRAGGPAAGASQQQQQVAPSANGAAAAQGTGTAAKPAESAGGSSASASDTSAVGAGATFVPAAKPGRRPAVLLVTGGGAAATAEAKELSRLGVGTMVVGGDVTLSGLRAALASLRAGAQVDPAHLGVVAEGPGATAAAKLVAETPALSAVVLANPAAGVERPVKRFSTTHVLLQRGEDSATMTGALAKRLVISAPAGTLLHEFDKLGPGSRRDRDRWVSTALQ